MNKCECIENINNRVMYHYEYYCPYTLPDTYKIQPIYDEVINNNILKIGECAQIAWGIRGDMPCFVRNNNNILEFDQFIVDLYTCEINQFIESYIQIMS